MGVDRYRVCELYAVAPGAEGSGSGYRLGDRLVLTARHVIAPVLAGAGGRVLVRPVGVPGWLPARVEWEDADADAALAVIEDEGWRAPAGESVLRWGDLAGSDPVPCAAVGFPWASARPDRVRDTAHVYGQLAPLGELRQGWLDVDVASASPSAREGGSPWAGMSGAAVIADSHLVGVITVDPARYQGRLVAVPTGSLLADKGFRVRLAAHGVSLEVAPVGAGWHLRLPGGQAVSLAPPYRPVSRRFGPESSTLLRPEHGLVPFLGRQAVLDQVTGWCQDPAGRPVLLVIGGGGSGKTRLGREACVQMLMAGWDAGLADDTRRDGAATDRLARPTLLVIDDAELRPGLISALVEYLRWDDAGPPAALLLLARATGAWWDRLALQQGLAGASAILDLDRHPIPLADRAEHFRRASAAFADYGGPGAQLATTPPTAELADPAYAEPLLIHIAALLDTVDIPATPAPSGPGQDRAPNEDITAGQPGPPVRQRLLRALCERERTRWYTLGEQSHLSFNPDLPLVDQVIALATLTAADDQACATSLLAALPNQAEVTRIGAEALAAWAHRLYAGPGYWNPLRPDLLAEQHLADTAQLPALVGAAARLAAGQRWEDRVLTQLLAELTPATRQLAVRAALNELFAVALPRIVDLAAKGDYEAWNGIVEQYAALIWSICRRHGLDVTDAEDVGQTVWLRLVNHLSRFRDPAALPKWLATTTRRECRRMLKARRSKRLDKKLADSLPSADDVMIDLETFTRNAALRAALAELSPRDQQLVSMLSSDPPHSFAEISAELGIPVESISQERARCYAQMRRHPAVAALTNTEAGEPGRYSRAEDGADS